MANWQLGALSIWIIKYLKLVLKQQIDRLISFAIALYMKNNRIHYLAKMGYEETCFV